MVPKIYEKLGPKTYFRSATRGRVLEFFFSRIIVKCVQHRLYTGENGTGETAIPRMYFASVSTLKSRLSETRSLGDYFVGTK